MPPITAQDLEGSRQLVPRSSRAFTCLGLTVVFVLCVADVVGGLVVSPRGAANLSGTMALAPALTALSRSLRHTLAVGVIAVVAAATLAVLDGVPWGTGGVRTFVVVAGAVLSAVVARVQGRQWSQLQDRRQAARTLQAAMLTRLPRPDHLQLLTRYLPASSGDQVGGDWFDAVVDTDGCTVLVIGDVVGHDIHAAAAMGQLRGVLRAYAVEGGQSPAQILRRVDEVLERLGLQVLATVVLARVEQDAADAGTGRRRVRWSNAGHPPPMLLPPPGAIAGAGAAAGVRRLDGEPDLMLGLGLPGVQRSDHVSDLPVGSTLLLYTDGLVERRGEELDEGLHRLAQVMSEVAAAQRRTPRGPARSTPPLREAASEADAEFEAEALDEWLDALLRSALPDLPQDDVAVLAVRAHPEDRPRPSAAGRGRTRPGPALLSGTTGAGDDTSIGEIVDEALGAGGPDGSCSPDGPSS